MKKLMLVLTAAMVSLAGFAVDDRGNWFHADCSGPDPDYKDWFAFGGHWLSPSTSEYTEPSYIYDDNERSPCISMEDVPQSAPVTFQADCPTNTLDGTATLYSEFLMTGFSTLPDIDPEAKAGVCALTGGDIYVVEYDSVGETNRWKDTGIEADFEHRMRMSTIIGTNHVSYVFSSTGWDNDVSYTIEATVAGGEMGEVLCSGNGEVFRLEGSFDFYYGVDIVFPVFAGSEHLIICEAEGRTKAYPGDRITVCFSNDTWIATVSEAEYIVRDDGTLELVSGQDAPGAILPAASIGSDLYAGLVDAVAEAEDGSIITLYKDCVLGTNLIDKALLIDVCGHLLTVDGDVALPSLTYQEYLERGEAEILLSIMNSDPEVGSGFLIGQGVTLSIGSFSTLDLAGLPFGLDKGGFGLGTGASLTLDYGYVNFQGTGDAHEDTANWIFANYPEIFGGSIPQFGGVVVVTNMFYGYAPAGDDPPRFLKECEICYATPVGEDYVESYSSLQDALDNARVIYLDEYVEMDEDYGDNICDEDVVFGPGCVVYGNADQLTGTLRGPSGYKVVYDSDQGAYILESVPAVTVTVNPPADVQLFLNYTVYTNGEAVTELPVSGQSVISGLYPGDRITIVPVYADPTGGSSGIAYDVATLSGMELVDSAEDLFVFEIDGDVTTAAVTLAEPMITYYEYELNFVMNGGQWTGRWFEPPSVYAVTNETFALPTAENISRDEYIFSGWYTNEAFVGESIAQVEQGTFGDLTFYARWISARIPIVLPEIEGLSVSCDVNDAVPGSEVTLYFAGSATQIPSRASAQYEVQEDGTLILSDGGSAPVAVDPGASNGAKLYATFEEAYADAQEGDTITICSNVLHVSTAMTIAKSVTVDFVDNTLLVESPMTIADGATLTVVTSSSNNGGFGLDSVLTIEDGGVFDCSSLTRCGFGGFHVWNYTAKLNNSGTVRFSNAGAFANNSANKFLINDYQYLLENIGVVNGGVYEIGGKTYTGTSTAPARYVVNNEVAYAVPDSYTHQYVESYDSVQAALDAASTVTLTAAGCSDDLVFPSGRKIIAAEGALTGRLTPPSGYGVVYDSDEGAYVLQEVHLVDVTVNPPADAQLFLNYTVYTNGTAVTDVPVSGQSVISGLGSGDRITIAPVYADPAGGSSGIAYDTATLSGMTLVDSSDDVFVFEIADDVTTATVTLAEPTVTYYEYELNFVMNGGQWSGMWFEPPSVYAVTNETFELPTVVNVFRYGYLFRGWYTNETFAGEAVTRVEQGTVGDLTFYAKWIAAYPSYIPLDDDDAKAAYDGWAAKFGDDPDGENLDAFLLDCDPRDVEHEKAYFVITGISKSGDDWIVTVTSQHKRDGERFGNGYINIVPAVIPGASSGAVFMKATLTVTPENSK